MKKRIAFVLATIGVASLATRCDSGSSDCTQTSTCPQEAGPDVAPLSCDMTKDPKDDPGCVDDRVGIFVSASGSDTNAGTKEAPVQTIAKALSLTTTLKRVYACAGTYAEDVSLSATTDGVSIYGGFQCSDWSYVGNNVTIGKGNIPLTISGTTKALAIEDLIVQAAAGGAGNATSIAALVANASGAVTLARLALNAGAGANGADGAAGSNYNASLAQSDPSIAGHNATGITGGSPQTCSALCTDATASSGGGGGNGGSGSNGSDGLPALGGQAPNDGLHGTGGATCTNGDHGANAATAGADAVSPTTTGTLSASGWTPVTSGSGKNGSVGQGGGGGGGAAANNAGGGAGGGCGGCGGGGGSGGASGGGSIGLAVFNSTVNVIGSQIHATNGGSGGKGGDGQVGQLGGYSGLQSNPGCVGGTGGEGSAGGNGAGGAGGISVGVLYSGAQPTLDSATTGAITVGTAGNKGIGGTAGSNDGIDGVAQPIYQSP